MFHPSFREGSEGVDHNHSNIQIYIYIYISSARAQGASHTHPHVLLCVRCVSYRIMDPAYNSAVFTALLSLQMSQNDNEGGPTTPCAYFSHRPNGVARRPAAAAAVTVTTFNTPSHHAAIIIIATTTTTFTRINNTAPFIPRRHRQRHTQRTGTGDQHRTVATCVRST